MKQQRTNHQQSEFLRTARAFKAARLQCGLSRIEAAAKLAWSEASIEQIENARCNLSHKRLLKILDAYELTEAQFARIKDDPKLAIAEACSSGKSDRSVARKPRRNHFKIVTKEVRAIRILRKRKRVSQYKASRLCGFVPGAFGHIEVGRVDLTPARIKHILRSLGYVWKDFEELMNATVLRDELEEEISKLLSSLDDRALINTANIVKTFIK